MCHFYSSVYSATIFVIVTLNTILKNYTYNSSVLKIESKSTNQNDWDTNAYSQRFSNGYDELIR